MFKGTFSLPRLTPQIVGICSMDLRLQVTSRSVFGYACSETHREYIFLNTDLHLNYKKVSASLFRQGEANPCRVSLSKSY